MPDYQDIRSDIQDNKEDRKDKLAAAIKDALDRFNQDHQVFFTDDHSGYGIEYAYDGHMYNHEYNRVMTKAQDPEGAHEAALRDSLIHPLKFSVDSYRDEHGHCQFTVDINNGGYGVEIVPDIVPDEEPGIAVGILSRETFGPSLIEPEGIADKLLETHYEQLENAHDEALQRDMGPEHIDASDQENVQQAQASQSAEHGSGRRPRARRANSQEAGQSL